MDWNDAPEARSGLGVAVVVLELIWLLLLLWLLLVLVVVWLLAVVAVLGVQTVGAISPSRSLSSAVAVSVWTTLSIGSHHHQGNQREDQHNGEQFDIHGELVELA